MYSIDINFNIAIFDFIGVTNISGISNKMWNEADGEGIDNNGWDSAGDNSEDNNNREDNDNREDVGSIRT